MIIGFGSCEIETAKRIMRTCLDNSRDSGNRLEHEIEISKTSLGEDAERFRAMSRNEAPQRYSTFWASVYRIRDDLTFARFRFKHINRDHPMSPDGWASLVTTWILEIDGDDVRIYQEV